ncbi:MAG: hypothetical protein RLZZ297_1641 [Chloroflexota bacterium]|jgi:uncharacterized membrane protein YkvA (DUF1232 family)
MKGSAVKPPSRVPTFVLFISAVFSVIYLVNPTAGIIEFIPDNIPFIGNLDEAGATALLMWAINQWRVQRDKPAPRDVTND